MKCILKLNIIYFACFLSSCGTEENANFKVSNDHIVLQTDFDIEQNLVLENSYIVAFKTKSTPLTLVYKSYLQESKFHYSYLDSFSAKLHEISKIDYLISVDLDAYSDNKSLIQKIRQANNLEFELKDKAYSSKYAALTRVDFKSKQEAKNILHKWYSEGRIWFANPNYLSKIAQVDSTAQTSLYGGYAKSIKEANIWWHNMIHLSEAYTKISNRDSTNYPTDDAISAPLIAIIDTGTDVNHKLLKDRVWENSTPGVSLCGDDRHGCNTGADVERGQLGSADIKPYALDEASATCTGNDIGRCLHGTHVAGIAVAAMDGVNSVGGVCQVCKVMTIKAVTENKNTPNSNGTISDSAQLKGFRYILQFNSNNGSSAVRVANLSLGKYTRDRAVTTAISVLRKKPFEVLVVAAASNEDSIISSYPASLGDAISVAALSENYDKASYSNFGVTVNIAAPGGGSGGSGIASTTPGNNTQDNQGTSMASPVVAGVAGLLLSVEPNQSWEMLYNRILYSADCVKLYDSEVNAKYNPKSIENDSKVPLLGYGILDASSAFSYGGEQECAKGEDSKRVVAGCGTLQSPLSSIHSLLVLMLFLSLPWLLSVFVKLKRSF